MAGKSNVLERRRDLLAERVERRIDALTRLLVEPQPAFRVKLSPEDQLRRYLDMREAGTIGTLRQSQGGPYTDAEVDRMVQHMEREVAKAAPHMLIRDLQDPPEFARTPHGIPEGALAAMGLDGREPAKPPPDYIPLSERYNEPRVKHD